MTNSKTHWQDFLAQNSQAAPAVHPSVDSYAGEVKLKPSHSVGSAVCLECHSGQTESYQQTSHYRSARWIRDSGAHVPTRFTDEPSNRLYEVTPSSNGLTHSEKIFGPGEVLIAADSADLVLEIGSGLHAHSYLMHRDGFWVQSPLTWYAQPQRWDLSPGYDPIHEATFDRVVTTNCVFCHVGQVGIHGNDMHRFSIKEVSIGCERCHGPADQHVADQQQRAKQGTLADAGVIHLDGGRNIINPVSLSREQQEGICSQCHLQGIVFARSSGFDRWDFVPGQLLSDSITEYQLDGVDSQFRIVGHTEQLHASACYLQTETLTCITCHDPHAPPPSREEYRQSCIECHQSKDCGLPEDTRIRAQKDDCSACHMPIRPTNVTHAALHDHRIAVHDRSYALAGLESQESHRPLAMKGSSTPRLVSITDQSRLESWQQKRRWSLAMHSLAFQDAMPKELVPDFQRAKTLLLGLHREGITDASMQVTLAQDYLDAGLLSAARGLADRVVSETDAGQSPYLGAADVLGRLALRAEDNQSALHWYRQLTKLRRVSGDFFLLGLCESNAGNVDAAIAAFEQALRIDPTLLPAHEHLARLLHDKGDTQRSQLHQKTITSLRARLRQTDQR